MKMKKNKPTVLVVEDDKYIANAYAMKFAKADVEAKIAMSAGQAFSLLEEYKPDCIVLDLIMPVKDGFQVLRELKESNKYKNIPVIIASNLGTEADINEAMELGAYEYIVKSRSTLDSLIKKIKAIV